MIHMVSLGCPKNYADSEVLLGMVVEQSGLVPVAEPEQATVIVVNTCAFLTEAVEEAVDTILEMGEYKVAKGGRCRFLGVIGCLGGRYDGETLRSLLPEVDCFLGPARTGELARVVAAALEGTVDCAGLEAGRGAVQEGEPALALDRGRGSVFLYDHTMPRLLTRPYTAYVKIADGCNRRCTFCTIPSIKGRQRSRPVEDVVAEVTSLALSGVKEFNLVAQDLTAYGSDLPGEPKVNLTMLLEELVRIPQVVWIRLLYLYPGSFPPGLIDLMSSRRKICPYVDMPVQHVAEPVVKAMGRGHTGRSSIENIAQLRARVPGVVIRTSLLVGFPGETEDDFALLEETVAQGTFDEMGVFVFSPEEGTPAALMENQVPGEVAEQRRDRLLSIQQGISGERNQRLVGTTQWVLVEGTHPESDLLLQGRTAWQAPEVDGVVLINDLGDRDSVPGPGELVQVEITEAHPYDLVGRVVS